MELIIVHHHFRPGGVRRVIELAAPYLAVGWPQPLEAVVLATGEAPPASWLRDFRRRLKGTPVKVVVEFAFGYASEIALEGVDLRRAVAGGLAKLFQSFEPGACLVWAHNLGLGRNLRLARELTSICHRRGIPLLAQHHDWWFENRWHHFPAMRAQGFRLLPQVARAVFAISPGITHLAINQADARVLKRHLGAHGGWLPNPVEFAPEVSASRIKFTRAWLRRQMGESAPVWLVPCRLLRRKNLAEALLLTRWLRPEAWLVTTGGASSAREQTYASALAAAAQKHHWRLRLGLLRDGENGKPSLPELMAASETILLTSLQEGFGLPYLEAAAARRPLIARALPNISPDLAQFGFRFPQIYREIMVAPALFDWLGEQDRQTHLFAKWKSALPRAAAKLARPKSLPMLHGNPRPVPFSRLTLAAQLEVLAAPLEQSWRLCARLNPQLDGWRRRAAAGQLSPSPWPPGAAQWLAGPAYARRFLELIPRPRARSVTNSRASEAIQNDFFRQKLRAANFYPMLWEDCA